MSILNEYRYGTAETVSSMLETESTVSPHEMLAALINAMERIYQLEKQVKAGEQR